MPATPSYGKEIEEAIQEICSLIREHGLLTQWYGVRWLAIKLLEGDREVIQKLSKGKFSVILAKAKELREKLSTKYGDLEAYFADKRYEFVEKVVDKAVKKGSKRPTMTDILDSIFLHKYLGIPIFISFMWMVFKFTFDVATPFVELIDLTLSYLSDMVRFLVHDELVSSLLTDGIIGGVGAVLVFVPNIFFLFLALSIMEDSGYLARVAFIMDRAMRKFGLGGRSMIPMLLGFGCNVPAIMATRTIPSGKDRLLAILINPLMSCSARLPVYLVIAGSLFAYDVGSVVLSLYLLGMLLALILAFIFRKMLFGGKPSQLIMEMPPYLVPDIRSVLSHMWERGSIFLKKAGTIILLGMILVWTMSNLPTGKIETSLIGMLGHALQPLFAPLGFGDWRVVASLLFGFVAKEIVVGSLAQLYGVIGGDLNIALHQTFTPVTAYAFMTFVLIYIPCLATIGVIKQETGSYKWTAFAVVYGLTLAYLIALLIVAVGTVIYR